MTLGIQFLGWENLLSSPVWTVGLVLVIAMILAALQEQILHSKKFRHPKVERPPPLVSLSKGYVKSYSRTYEFQEQVGIGDLCDVFFAQTYEEDFLVKYARAAGGETLLGKEFSVLEQLHRQAAGQVYQQYFPQPVESFLVVGRQVNTFVWQDGLYSAEQILARHPGGLDGRHLGWMFNRILEALGFVHQQGWIHGAVLPPHLLFQAEDHGLQLAGWIHAEKANTALKVVPERFKNWYPPECRKKHPATLSVDLYLAAKSLIYLAGGDPVLETFPDRIPRKLRQFVKGCLLESPRMRSQDAWKVRQEFGELLEGLYGPPAFHPLVMS